MGKPEICLVITSADASIIENASQYADLFELRLDMIGSNWPSILPLIQKPWIATCRLESEGGSWNDSEARRKEELLKAINKGASMVDLELSTPNLERLAPIIKKAGKLILSYHNYTGTPCQEELEAVIEHEFAAGADIAKIATMANSIKDAFKVLQVGRKFLGKSVVSIAMGEKGTCSRILAPLAGCPFTYASAVEGQESADGQIPASELKNIYSLLETL